MTSWKGAMYNLISWKGTQEIFSAAGLWNHLSLGKAHVLELRGSFFNDKRYSFCKKRNDIIAVLGLVNFQFAEIYFCIKKMHSAKKIKTIT